MDEKLYLVCRGCGEAFDTLEAAKAHETTGLGMFETDCFAEDYIILPESEAM